MYGTDWNTVVLIMADKVTTSEVISGSQQDKIENGKYFLTVTVY